MQVRIQKGVTFENTENLPLNPILVAHLNDKHLSTMFEFLGRFCFDTVFMPVRVLEHSST